MEGARLGGQGPDWVHLGAGVRLGRGRAGQGSGRPDWGQGVGVRLGAGSRGQIEGSMAWGSMGQIG